MKYLVKNITSGEEVICEKVVVDGLEYYVSEKQAIENDYGYIDFQGGEVKKIGKHFADDWKKVIATTNKSLDIPMVIDEVEGLAIKANGYSIYAKDTKAVVFDEGYHVGYSKAKETYSYTKENMVDLIQSLKDYTHESHNILGHDEREAEEFFDIWQEQRTKTILVK